MGLSLLLPPFFSTVNRIPIIWVWLCIILLHQCNFASAKLSGNETDKLALLSIKSQITHDPTYITSSWNNSHHFCHWKGVVCGRRHRRVIGLNMDSLNLAGAISPAIGNLSFLRTVDLSNNSFRGEIPRETGWLFRLQKLNLSYNLLDGQIPVNLSRCSNLRSLGLYGNKLIGNIPDELGSLSELVRLDIGSNNLTGEIPTSFGNLSSLEFFLAPKNMLEGSIPYSLGSLRNLIGLEFSSNKLSEYGMGHDVYTSGDVYSYGILLLEMFTGKRPTDGMFKGGMNIHKFAKMSLPERVMEIVDRKLLEDEEGASKNSTTNLESGKTHDWLILILKLGVACSEESPSERVTIGDAARELHLIKEMLVCRRTGIDFH